MAINTPKPISREEKYLSKIGGNEEVIVPKPISREEKYMYRAAGYDDQPIPDYPIGRNEKYWAKIVENGGGSEVGSTVAFDSGQKFISDNSNLKDYKIYGNGGEIRPTGVLPLTFTAKGGTAADWVIEGNDDNGTENLFDKNTYTEIRAWIKSDGEIQEGSLDWQVSDYIPIEANEYYTISNVVGFTPAYCLYDSNKNYISGNTYANNTKIIFQAPANAAFARFSVKYGSISGVDPNIDVFMVTKGSTAPDHYIPYQKGVGERTKNLLKITAETQTINGVTFTVDETTGTITADGTENRNTTIGVNNYVTVDTTGSYILSGCPAEGSSQTWEITVQAGNTVVGRARPNPATVMLTAGVLYTVRCVVRNNVRCDNLVFKPMVRPASTSDTFIPYGYYIPLTVSQQGQTDKNYDIYIGDSPLTEGETVNKQSTGVDLEMFDGENTVSTTLYNKPTMEIEANYGVGVKDNNHYIIPFKVNTTTYNIQIGDSPLYDGEYLSYKEKKLYKYIDSVLTPIDPPSPFPEISTTEGVNKVIIETSIQPNSIFITTQNPIKLVQPNIGIKTITQNGVYNASDDNLDGYSSVTVNTN